MDDFGGKSSALGGNRVVVSIQVCSGKRYRCKNVRPKKKSRFPVSVRLFSYVYAVLWTETENENGSVVFFFFFFFFFF